MKISGSVALVTGGCGGLGRAIADMLAERGARVVVADCNPEALAQLPEGFIPRGFQKLLVRDLFLSRG